MILDHAAIWTPQIEKLKAYYIQFFGACSNEKYVNAGTGFESYFLHFDSGARLEIMSKPGIPPNANDTIGSQHLGLIHLAFALPTREEVNRKAVEIAAGGFPILRGPRQTGDGYYEFETLDPDNNRIEVTTLQGAASVSEKS